ncbi:hypothetical protein N2152v2_007885 [Parachlorella kessleri]
MAPQGRSKSGLAGAAQVMVGALAAVVLFGAVQQYSKVSPQSPARRTVLTPDCKQRRSDSNSQQALTDASAAMSPAGRAGLPLPSSGGPAQRQFARELLLGEPAPEHAPRCVIESYRTAEDSAACMDEYSHPFSGCFSPDHEEELYKRFRAGQPVSELRCGFLGAEAQSWLANISAQFSHCEYVILTVSFSYGSIKPAEHVARPQPGVCFVAFVDEAIYTALPAEGPALWNGTHFSRWQVLLVEPTMFAETIARSSHLLKLLAPRMFPAARYSLYVDRKVKLPRDPMRVIQLVEQVGAQHVLATFNHTIRQDVFEEMIGDLWHLGKRRLWGRSTDQAESYMKGIRGRDFHDIFRVYEYYQTVGFPTHRTGMLDSMLLVWNHGNPCTAALACLWHNQVAYLSMREQLSFPYVAALLGVTDQVLFVEPFSYNLRGNLTVRPAGWPRAGTYTRDSLW